MTISISFAVIVVLLFLVLLLEKWAAINAQFSRIAFTVLFVLLVLSVFYVNIHR